MEGLRKFTCIDKARHNPAVGQHFGRKTLGGMLIVGESHYGGEEWRRPDSTHNLIQAIIEGKKVQYFTKIARLFQTETELGEDSVAQFYSSVAFYNFLPDPLDRPGQRVALDLFKRPEDQRFLFKVIDQLAPGHMIVMSERLWRVLPSRHPDDPQGIWRVTDDSTNLFVPFTPEEESEEEKRRSRECFWYRRADGGFCLVGAISHPRTPNFNANRMRSKDLINKFMTTKKPC